MNIKDCLLGQVRKINGFPDAKCTDLPNDLSSIVTKQELITWDNATGMNPLYDSMPDVTIALLSYGEMLENAWEEDSIWMEHLTNNLRFSRNEYENLIREDFSGPFALACKCFAQWWHMDRFLCCPDVLEYDYVILRQIDTLFNPHCNAEMLHDEMARRNQKVFWSEEIPTGIPVCYDLSLDMNRRHASSTMITSHAFILNRTAVEVLQHRFFQLAIDEIDRYYLTLGPHNFLLGDPGGIMHRICIKQDVEPLSLREVFIRPEICRGGEKGGKTDFANLDRIGHK